MLHLVAFVAAALQPHALRPHALRPAVRSRGGAVLASAFNDDLTEVTLSDAQVAAFGEPAVRPISDRVDLTDYLGRPLKQQLTDAQLAAFGPPAVRTLSWPSPEEDGIQLLGRKAQIDEALAAKAAEVNEILLSTIALRAELSAVNEATLTVAMAVKAAGDAKAVKAYERALKKEASASGANKVAATAGDDADPAVVGGAIAALVAAVAWYSTQAPALAQLP